MIKKPFLNVDFDLAALKKINNSVSVMNRYLPLGLLIGLLITFRILGGMLPMNQPNFQPIVALFFCGALLATGSRAFLFPFGIWAVTYPFAQGPVWDLSIFLTTLIALTTTFLLGKALSHRGVPTLLAGSVVAAVMFHIITNGAAWIGDPTYEKSLMGLWQSLWTGPANSLLPSWIFLRNLIAANFLFTGIFAVVQFRLPKSQITIQQTILVK
jgi:hypothetical protein